jgi:hypothetical protein
MVLALFETRDERSERRRVNNEARLLFVFSAESMQFKVCGIETVECDLWTTRWRAKTERDVD